MKQFYIYEYDQRNRYLFFEAAEEKGLTFLTLHFDEQLKQDLEEVHNSGVIFDITPYFRDDEKAQSFSLIIESIRLVNCCIRIYINNPELFMEQFLT